ncbi:DUF6389 family protein [Amycolatopsis sp. QT-25]|uniref:DUF6389 family protein n=1 Tax=Amycolatopsis sp. QT-25 TaxID=3034022 RepID=UPI0023EC177D|nr:DUF6389 family protein [Amycolatopsis sp. QT-25]WET76357.1 DUF6389 family protein [Amycolatopsis sp. QT-25]
MPASRPRARVRSSCVDVDEHRHLFGVVHHETGWEPDVPPLPRGVSAGLVVDPATGWIDAVNQPRRRSPKSGPRPIPKSMNCGDCSAPSHAGTPPGTAGSSWPERSGCPFRRNSEAIRPYGFQERRSGDAGLDDGRPADSSMPRAGNVNMRYQRPSRSRSTRASRRRESARFGQL